MADLTFGAEISYVKAVTETAKRIAFAANANFPLRAVYIRGVICVDIIELTELFRHLIKLDRQMRGEADRSINGTACTRVIC